MFSFIIYTIVPAEVALLVAHQFLYAQLVMMYTTRILLLQAMMGAHLLLIIVPLVLILVAVVSTGVAYGILRLFNRVSFTFSDDADREESKLTRKVTRRKHFRIALIVGLLTVAYYLFSLLTFKGPWIN